MVLFCSLTHLAVLTKGEILGGQSDCAWPVLTHDNACMDNMQSFTIFAKYPADGHNLVFRFVSLVFRRYIFLALCTLAIGSDPTRLPIEILIYVYRTVLWVLNFTNLHKYFNLHVCPSASYPVVPSHSKIPAVGSQNITPPSN